MLLHYPGKLENQIFCRYSANVEASAGKLHFLSFLTLLVVPHTDFFQFIVVLFIYFCDKFVAPEIRHSRRHCRVCQQSTWYSATRTRFWWKVCIWRSTQQTGCHLSDKFTEKSWTKCGVNKLLKKLRDTGIQKFEVLLSQGSVVTCLRSGMGFVTNFICFTAMQTLKIC